MSSTQGQVRSIIIYARSGATVGVLVHRYKLKVLSGMDFAAMAEVAQP